MPDHDHDAGAPTSSAGPSAEASPAPAERRSPAHKLVALAERAGAELFHDATRNLYVTLPVAGHLETYSLKSTDLRAWLYRAFRDEYRKPPTRHAVTEAVECLAASALNGPTHPVYVRVGGTDGALYLDLGRQDWAAVEITPAGWSVVARPPVRFRRGRATASLPLPVRGRPLAALMDFVPVNADDWPLLAAWLVGGFLPRGPYPLLVLQGEHGSAKSTAARLTRALVDPSGASVCNEPRDVRDLMIIAATNWVLSFDNLSRVREWLSDALCQLATGGGYMTRELYTDGEPVIFTAMRPVILNGITDLAEKDDLRDRVLIVTLPPIRQYREESELWADFEAARPELLGALLDAVSTGLRRIADVTLPPRVRMADFARWAVACEPALGLAPGAFLRAYTENRAQAVAASLDVSPLAQGVLRLVDRHTVVVSRLPPELAADVHAWLDTAENLLAALTTYRNASGEPITAQQARQAQRDGTMMIEPPFVPESARSGPDWPKGARALAAALKKLVPFLRQVGVEITFAGEPGGPTRRKDRKPIRIRRLPGDATGAGDATGDASDGRCVTRESPPNAQADTHLSETGGAGDASDANLHPVLAVSRLGDAAEPDGPVDLSFDPDDLEA